MRSCVSALCGGKIAYRCCYALLAVFQHKYSIEALFFNLFFVRWAKNIHIENQHFTNKITNK
jgi:hypothetical protein